MPAIRGTGAGRPLSAYTQIRVLVYPHTDTGTADIAVTGLRHVAGRPTIESVLPSEHSVPLSREVLLTVLEDVFYVLGALD